MDQTRLDTIREALFDCAERFKSTELFPSLVPEALELVMSDPYAFALAVSLDRGTKADVIWTIPYFLKNTMGHLDPEIINEMSLEELTAVFTRLPRRPRYVNDAPRTVKELTEIVMIDFSGDASGIWTGKTASFVNSTFQRVHGVGPAIANMAPLLIEEAFPNIRFEDKAFMDIKPDVHTMRVLYRLGVSQDVSFNSAIQAARELSPDFPGAVDGALWWIGRTWCFPTDPDCTTCCASLVCAKRIATSATLT
ncbi:MAG: hypothetical protein WEA61_01335 [Anaerolineales bacterium]